MRSDGSASYDPSDYPPVAVTVDVALFAIRRSTLHVLLIKRGIEPFEGAWALPGGFVQPDEGLDAAAARELSEETGVADDSVYLEQLRSYGSPGRDPRMRVVTVAYWGACAEVPSPIGGSDAAHAELVPVPEIEDGDIELAFDHAAIVSDALERVRAKLEYTALAARFCPPEFTISELRRVYEIVWSTKLDAGNFQRKVRENRSFQRVGRSAQAVAEQRSLNVAAQGICFDQAEANRAAADEVVASAAVYSRAPDEEFRLNSGQARTRSGRPASLWIVSNSELILNSPIHRRGAFRAG